MKRRIFINSEQSQKSKFNETFTKNIRLWNLGFPQRHYSHVRNLHVFVYACGLSSIVIAYVRDNSSFLLSLSRPQAHTHTFLNIKSVNIYWNILNSNSKYFEWTSCMCVCGSGYVHVLTHHKVSICAHKYQYTSKYHKTVCGCFGLVFILRVKTAHACIYFSTYTHTV